MLHSVVVVLQNLERGLLRFPKVQSGGVAAYVTVYEKAGLLAGSDMFVCSSVRDSIVLGFVERIN